MSDKLWKIFKTSSILILIIDILYILFAVAFLVMYRLNVLDIVTNMNVVVVITIVLLSINILNFILNAVIMLLKTLKR